MDGSIVPIEYLKDLTILYVEDDAVIGDLMAKTMSRSAKKLHRAYDGAEGLRVFKEVYPDIVVTDIRMPNMSGLEMIEKIREIDSKAKILITSAFSDVDYFINAIKYKTNGYILKPIDRNELALALNESAKIIHYENAMQRFLKYIQDIIDVQKSLIVIKDENLDYVRANQKFLNYFGCSDMYDIDDALKNFNFLKSASSIDVLLENSIENLEFLATKKDINTVQVKRDNTIDSFILNVSKLTNDANQTEYLIALTDVTELYNEKEKLEDIAQRDYLTGIYNRYKFNETFYKELIVAKRYNLGLSVIMFDIDDFKNVNDTLGHDIGDIVLKEIAKIATRNIRETDSVYRWGGEEFVILLPNSPAKNAYDLTERIRNEIQQHPFEHGITQITASFGISEYSNGKTIDNILKEADIALYQAKHSGKNKTITYKEEK